MSARGARSRKVQQKDIQKKEKKSSVKGKNPQTYDQSQDGFGDWPKPPSLTYSTSVMGKSFTFTSTVSRGTARSDESYDRSNRSLSRMNTGHSNEHTVHTHRQPKTAASDEISIPEKTSRDREKTTFEARGKETKAPRGRGGGVPIKRAVAPSPAPHLFLNDVAAYPSPNQKTWMNFMVWEGGKGEMRPYGGFDFDNDMQTGSVLIFFKEEQVDEERPIPSLRADLDILEFSGSTWLSSALHYGKIEDSDVDEWALPRTPDSLRPTQHFSPPLSHPKPRKMLAPNVLGEKLGLPHDSDRAYSSPRVKQLSEKGLPGRFHTPPPSRHPVTRNQPTHEIWFTAPNTVKTPQGQRLHHVAIRNFLALLHGKPLVGADFYEMLDSLQREIQIMYDIDGHIQSRYASRDQSVRMITEYIEKHHLDDVRNNVPQALGLLAWSEKEDVKWRQGYLESFVHLAGALTAEVEELPEFKRLSVVTRRNLGLTSKTLQLRVLEAEERLSTFDFSDLWGETTKMANNPVYQSYQHFRQFLVNYYARIYDTWPPEENSTWLNRKIVLALQEDFGSLYDYLVNRNVFWNPREERASRKWEMAHRQDEEFFADLPELQITDMLVTFDTKYGFSHIPHPYPLLPRQVPKLNKEKEKKSLLNRVLKSKTKDVTKDAKEHLQLSIFFSDATNIEKLDVNFNGSTLIDKFEKFELTTDLRNTTPREARLGRWVLLYGVLQVLSTLSVDVRGIRHRNGVPYFLCTDLKRCPDWVTIKQTDRLEAHQYQSWCWQRAWDPTPQENAPIELDASSIAGRNNLSRQNSREHIARRARSYSARGHPTPPPEHPLPAPPPADSPALLAHDIRRIGEKIDNISHKHSSSQIFRQELERRRENEKVMQREFQDKKAASNQSATMNTSRSMRSRENSLSIASDSRARKRGSSLSLFLDQRSKAQEISILSLTEHRNKPQEISIPSMAAQRLPSESEFRATAKPQYYQQQQQQHSMLTPVSLAPSSSLEMRSNLTNINTDLAGFPMTPDSMNFPSPSVLELPSAVDVSNRDSTFLLNIPPFEHGVEEDHGHRALAGLPAQDDWV